MTELNTLLKDFTTDGLDAAKDTLGGFQLLPSGIYLSRVKMAYITQSAGGATGVVLELDTGNHAHMETVWISSKTGANYYKGQNGEKKPLPGFTLINELCLLTTDKPLSQQEVETKKVEVFDFESMGKVLKAVPVLTELIGTRVHAGIHKQIENKQVKNAAGVYVATSDTREKNALNKVFHFETGQTFNEKEADAEARFQEQWVAKYGGVTLDKTTPVVEYAQPTQSTQSPTQGKTVGSAPTKPKKNIFQD